MKTIIYGILGLVFGVLVAALVMGCGDYIEKQIEELEPSVIIINQPSEDCEYCFIDTVVAKSIGDQWGLAISFKEGCGFIDNIQQITGHIRTPDGDSYKGFYRFANSMQSCLSGANVWYPIGHICDTPWCGDDTVVEILAITDNAIYQQVFVRPE